LAELDPARSEETIPAAGHRAPPAQRIQGFRQFRILSARDLRVLLHDKAALALVLALAPILGLLDLFWGSDLYSPYTGSAEKVVAMWFLGALSALTVGLFSSYRAFSRDAKTFQHERRTTLRLLPYYFSKLWWGIPFAVYQTSVLLCLRMVWVQPNIPTRAALFAIFSILFITVMTGYLLGLLISLITQKSSTAVSLITILLMLQLVLAGAFLPLDWFPGGRQISVLLPARWSYEALVRTSGLGHQFTAEACQMGYRQPAPINIKDSLGENCACMGASIFTDCADFPGVFTNFSAGEKEAQPAFSEARLVNSEMIIQSFFQNHPQIFMGPIFTRFIYLVLMQIGLVGLGLLLLKRKAAG
jgi:hypothetical protein